MFERLPWQSYITNLTHAQADDIRNKDFINFIDVIKGLEERSFGAIGSVHSIEKRVTGAENLDARPNSDQHLRVISAANQQPDSGPLSD